MSIEELKEILQAKYPMMEVRTIRHADLVFEERVRLKCYQCRNYQIKWTCPGKLPQIDFQKLIGEYEHLAVIICKQSVVGGQQSVDEYREAGNDLHRAMLYLESELMKRNNALAQSFIGGSCELCEGGCAPDKCAHPEQARVPWDAAGCNVMRSLENIGVQVDFTGTVVCRYGLFMW